MSRVSRLIVTAAAAGLAAMTAAAVALTADSGHSGSVGNAKLAACVRANKVCDSTAWKRLTSLPVARPPAAQARILTSAAAIAAARSGARAAATVPAASALMTGAEFVRRFGVSRNAYINRARLVWIVTVQTPIRTDGGLARPGKLFDHASFVIDAQTGTITDTCIGCAWLPAG